MPRLFGLIGHPLSHSFSKKYFTQKFASENLADCSYELFDLAGISELPRLWQSQPQLEGLNVTIPYKLDVIPYLDELDESAERVGAVNVIKKSAQGLMGYNSDYYGFKASLSAWLPAGFAGQALVLGTGGASKAVVVALEDLGIKHRLVSRRDQGAGLTYGQLAQDRALFEQFNLVVNTTPLGTYPQIDTKPELPYPWMDASFYLYDLVYNPETTAFMAAGAQNGANAKNGYDMLVLQAERSWEIWNQNEG
ncbi:MAG: shikimate dehydrogenase [Cytophagales bacterium]|nr:shikimate dehydrogenase [Cytophagales bacterium]